MLARRWKNWNPQTLLPGMENGADPSESSLVVSEEVKHSITIWPSNSTPRYVPQRTENRCSKKLYTDVYRSTIHNSPKVKTNQMSINWWMVSEIWYVHTMENYLAMKRYEALIRATTWINFEAIVLSERGQKQNITYCMISFTWNVHNRWIHRDRKQISGCCGLLGGGNGEWLIDGWGDFWGDEHMLE